MTTQEAITLAVLFSPWLIYLVADLVIVKQRTSGAPTRWATVSMVAKKYGSRLTWFAYMWGSMPTHWYWSAGAFAPTWAAVTFWLIPVALLVSDFALWGSYATWPPWLKTARHPLIWVAAGFLAGRFLFPQA